MEGQYSHPMQANHIDAKSRFRNVKSKGKTVKPYVQVMQSSSGMNIVFTDISMRLKLTTLRTMKLRKDAVRRHVRNWKSTGKS